MQQTGYDHKSRVLVVDDEEKICELLASVLALKYKVDTALCVTQALSCIGATVYDLVVTDLKLPDGNGIDVLRKAKEKDAHTEVIIVTAYASLETATDAINLGASSYLFKPISMPAFSAQVDKAVANRLFYLKSKSLLTHYKNVSESTLEHLGYVTQIYELSKKLVFSLNITDVMTIILEELIGSTEAALCTVGVNIYGFSEVYVIARTGKPEENEIRGLLHTFWKNLFCFVENVKFVPPNIRVKILESKNKDHFRLSQLSPVVVPMIFMGETKGSFGIFFLPNTHLSEAKLQYLHVFSSLVSPIIENSYIHERTKNLAFTDPLTGVANHRTFHEMLNKEIARANRDKSDFGLIILDIDDFKRVNDTYGHQVGDDVLKDLCKRVFAIIREQDLLARYGGEEFMVIVTSSNIKGTSILAERIRDEIATRPVWINDITIPYTVSLGFSIYNGYNPRSKESLVRDADDALYYSKKHGKNKVSFR